MCEVRPEFQALDRDELLGLCELLAVTSLTKGEKLESLILDARWTAAQNRANRAREAAYRAFDDWFEIRCRPGKLTAKKLAEQEKAKRRHSRLKTAESRAVKEERALWSQVSARWTNGGEAA